MKGEERYCKPLRDRERRKGRSMEDIKRRRKKQRKEPGIKKKKGKNYFCNIML